MTPIPESMLVAQSRDGLYKLLWTPALINSYSLLSGKFILFRKTTPDELIRKIVQHDQGKIPSLPGTPGQWEDGRMICVTCSVSVPVSDDAQMPAGWGWRWEPDPAAPCPDEGPFYACPAHRQNPSPVP